MKKIISILEMFLVISFSFAFSVSLNSSDVLGADVCCERTSGGNYCEYVDEKDCAGLKMPTTCEKASFCKTGCCVDKDGYCFANYPRALCEGKYGGQWKDDASCDSIAECSVGCCVLGTQASLMSEDRCKKLFAKNSGVSMDFRDDVKSETECVNLVRAGEKGCCVSGESWVYGFRSECSEGSSVFYKDKYCSQVPKSGCVASNPELGGDGDPKMTKCVNYDDSVHWVDSCGNDEGVNEKCDYSAGTLCGDGNKDGEFSCETVECTGNDFMSVFLPDYLGTPGVDEDGVRNGESWCLYDTPDIVGGSGTGEAAKFRIPAESILYHNRDMVGSRYYRSLCINGQELVEPCEDFRNEFCIFDSVDADLGGKSAKYTEAKCIENNWQSCIDDCNTANPAVQKEEGAYNNAIENDIRCCSDFTKRDCAWVGNKCVPKVAPGFKFWEDEGSDTCEKANLECSITVRCGGWNRITGCAGDWEIIDGIQCLSHDYLQASANLCRSYGDCGFKVNIQNKWGEDGSFINTDSLGGEFDESFYNIIGDGKKVDIDEEKYGKLGKLDFKGYSSKTDKIPGALENEKVDWNKGSQFFNFKEPFDDSSWFSKLWGQGWGDKGGHVARLKGSLFGVAVAGVIGMGVVSYTGAGILAKGSFFGGFLGWVPGVGDWSIWKVITGTLPTSVAKEAAEKAATEVATKAAQNAVLGKPLTEETSILFDQTYNSAYAKELAKQGVTGSAGLEAFMSLLNLAMWAYMVYQIGDVAFADTQTLTIKSECKPWIAPKTTDDCSKCNVNYEQGKEDGYVDKDGNPLSINALKKCSEYRCKSLGATCTLLNEGTVDELCVSESKFDVNSPVINPWVEGFDKEYQSKVQESAGGFKISEELPVYKRVVVAIRTDEPSQCKMSFEHSKDFKDMEPYFFGGPNYQYFHKQGIYFPSAKTENKDEKGLSLSGGGNYKVYVRCEDGVGNANEKDYVIEFDVSKEPDITPPVVDGSDPSGETFMNAETSVTDVNLYVNEPSVCKYSLVDQAYRDMDEKNKCTASGQPNKFGTYTCAFSGKGSGAVGPGVVLSAKGGESKLVYFRCQDKNQNTNTASYKITLKGSDPLSVDSVNVYSGSGSAENNKFFSSKSTLSISLEAKTSGGAMRDGSSECRFTESALAKSNYNAMEFMFSENSGSVHKQVFDEMPAGEHTYYVGCRDVAGNSGYGNVSFSLQIDSTPPLITKIYTTESKPSLAVATNELAACYSSIEKPFTDKNDGILMIKDSGANVHHPAEESDVYYVLCIDNYGNAMSSSITIMVL